MKLKMTYADFNALVTGELYKHLNRIIEAKQNYSLPYYIMAIIKDGYSGPPAMNEANQLIATPSEVANARNNKRMLDRNFEGKKVMTTRLVLMSKPPIVPMIGTALFYINNKHGIVKCCYCLPSDTPLVDDSVEFESESPLVGKCGTNMPLAYNN